MIGKLHKTETYNLGADYQNLQFVSVIFRITCGII